MNLVSRYFPQKRVIGALGTLALVASPVNAETDRSLRNIEQFLKSHCYDCHDVVSNEGGLTLVDLPLDAHARSNLARWSLIRERVEAGEMPPKTEARPAAKDVARFIESTGRKLTQAYASLYREQGRTPLRRLNPTEFEHTLRDLLASPQLQIRAILPKEPSAGGFDNVAEAQDFSYVQMSRYLQAAEVAIDTAMDLRPRPEITTVKAGFGESPRFINRDGWAVMLRQPNSAQAPWRISGKRQKDAGWYRITVRCKTVFYKDRKIFPSQDSQVAAINTAAKRFLHTFDVHPEEQDIRFTAFLNRDELLEFYCADLSDRQCPRDKDVQENKVQKLAYFQGDGIAVKYIEVEGPFASPACNQEKEPWPSPGYRALFGELPTASWTKESGLVHPEKLHIPDLTANKRGAREPLQYPQALTMVVSRDPLADAERLLRNFMNRAYRRGVPESEFARCFAFAEAAIERKACFQDVMRVAYKAALGSPDFLFLGESPGALGRTELANRLSYFLWRSASGESLKSLELTDRDTLSVTVDVMLDDPRAKRFVEDFCGQWLDLRKLHDTSPDRYLFPEYWGDTHLFHSAKAETEATFSEMIRRDSPAVSIVRSDFAMLNERLAELYGIPGITGSELRPVTLPADSTRGGFLTQASVMKVTANGLTTSPVIRGAWILERILGDEPSPPPPNVGSIEPDTRGATTVREQLEKHREVESCASCHREIDPPGFAMESFDVMGGWRNKYRTTETGEPEKRLFASKEVSFKRGPEVDASGETPDGHAFSDFREYRQYLDGREETIARNLVKRLITFATGAAVTFADEPVVDEILENTKAKQYGIRSLIREVVLSEAFRNK